MLLRETDVRGGLLWRLAQCFVDRRQPGSVEHAAHTLVSQREHGLAPGYEDLDDHDALRGDSVLALLVGKRDLMGAGRGGEHLLCARLTGASRGGEAAA